MFAKTPKELLFEYPLAYLQYIIMLLLSGDPGNGGLRSKGKTNKAIGEPTVMIGSLFYPEAEA